MCTIREGEHLVYAVLAMIAILILYPASLHENKNGMVCI